MKTFLLLFLLLSAAPALAQQKYAVVDTSRFSDDLLEYKQKIGQINREFEDRIRTVQKLAGDLRAAEMDMETNRLNYTEPVRQEKNRQIETLRKQYKRLSEDLEEAVQKRSQELIDPVKDKVIKELGEFALANGIDLILDISTAAERMGLVQVSPEIDITKAFAAYYNSKYR